MLLLVLIPLLAVGAFAIALVQQQTDVSRELEATSAVVEMSASLNDLLLAMQDEVLASADYVAQPSTGPQLARENNFRVDRSRVVVNRRLADAWATLDRVGPALPVADRDRVGTSLASTVAMLGFRPDVDERWISPLQIADRFGQVGEQIGAAAQTQLISLDDNAVTTDLLAMLTMAEVGYRQTTEQLMVAYALERQVWVPGAYERAIGCVAAQRVATDLIDGLVGGGSTLAPSPQLVDLRDRVLAGPEDGFPAAEEMATWNDLNRQRREEIREASQVQRTRLDQRTTELAEASLNRFWIVIAAIAVAVVTMSVAFLGTMLYAGKVRRITRQMVEIAHGNLDLPQVGPATAHDEIDQMAQAFDGMTEHVRAAQELEAQEAAVLEQIARGDSLASITRSIAALATNQTSVPHTIVEFYPASGLGRPIHRGSDTEPIAWLAPEYRRDEDKGRDRLVQTTCVGLAALAYDRRRTDQHLTYQATHDLLTGVANRGVLVAETDRALRDTDRELVAMLYCDLDGFKGVNDGYGHQAGDGLLVDVAARLRRILGTSGLITRVGGDEFVILFDDVASTEEAIEIASQVIEAMERPFDVARSKAHISVSVGIAVTPGGIGSEDLIRNADLALYRAKALGRGRYEVFDDELGAWAAKKVSTADALRRAIDEEQLEVWYQPVFGIEEGLAGFEGLVRWNRPGHGIVSPIDFLEIAEDTGMIIPLGNHVLAQGCAQLAAWHAAGSDCSLSINISGAQLIHADFAEQVSRALDVSGAPAERLVVEVTETVLLENRDIAVATLAELREMGVRVAIDDFGTGYSSLAYLRELPIDILKIDKAFVDSVADGPQDQAIVRAVVSIAEALSMFVIAEGVEHPEQLRALKALGCDGVQGFLLAKPMTGSAATRLIDERGLVGRTAASAF